MRLMNPVRLPPWIPLVALPVVVLASVAHTLQGPGTGDARTRIHDVPRSTDWRKTVHARVAGDHPDHYGPLAQQEVVAVAIEAPCAVESSPMPVRARRSAGEASAQVLSSRPWP